MSTPATRIENVHPTTSNAAATPLSTKELEKQISSLPAEDIALIAMKMTANIMKMLKIDTAETEVKGMTKTTVDGETFPITMTQFDLKSKMIQAILPSIAEQITTGFATSSLLITLKLFSADKSGILDQISDEFLKPRIDAAKERIITDGGLPVEMTLSPNPHSDKALYFDIKQNYKGDCLSLDGGTIETFHKFLACGIV